MAAIFSNGTGGGDWSNAASWSGGVVPVEGDFAIIQSGDTITIDHDAFTLDTGVHYLKIGGDGKNAITYSFTMNHVTDIVTVTDHGLIAGDCIEFLGAPIFGGGANGAPYYVHSVINENTFYITSSIGGSIFNAGDTRSGSMWKNSFSIVNYGTLNFAYDTGIDGDTFEIWHKGTYYNAGIDKIGLSATPMVNRNLTHKINYSATPTTSRYTAGNAAGSLRLWYGENKTMDTILTSDVIANNSNRVFTVASATNWRVGDIVVLADERNKILTDERIIESIDGTAITVTAPFGLAVSSGVTSTGSTTNTVNKTAHGLLNGDIVRFNATGIPSGLVIDTNYYVVISAANTFKVSETANGTAIAIGASAGLTYYQGSKMSDWFVLNIGMNIVVIPQDTTKPTTFGCITGDNVWSNVMLNQTLTPTFTTTPFDNSNNDVNISFYKTTKSSWNNNVKLQTFNSYGCTDSPLYIVNGSGGHVIYKINLVGNAANMTGPGGIVDGAYDTINILSSSSSGLVNVYNKLYIKNFNAKSISNIALICGGHSVIENISVKKCTSAILCSGHLKVKNATFAENTSDIVSTATVIIENLLSTLTTGSNAYGCVHVTKYNNTLGMNKTFREDNTIGSDADVFRTTAPSLKCTIINVNRVPFILSGNARTAYVNNNKIITLNCYTQKDIASTEAKAKLRIAYGTDGHGLSETTEYDILPTATGAWESKSINLGTTTSAGFITLELVVTKGASAWNLWIDDLEIVES